MKTKTKYILACKEIAGLLTDDMSEIAVDLLAYAVLFKLLKRRM